MTTPTVIRERGTIRDWNETRGTGGIFRDFLAPDPVLQRDRTLLVTRDNLAVGHDGPIRAGDAVEYTIVPRPGHPSDPSVADVVVLYE